LGKGVSGHQHRFYIVIFGKLILMGEDNEEHEEHEE
jgi:hypothetical protein